MSSSKKTSGGYWNLDFRREEKEEPKRRGARAEVRRNSASVKSEVVCGGCAIIGGELVFDARQTSASSMRIDGSKA